MRSESVEPIFIHPGDSSLADKIFACTGIQIDESVKIGPTSICLDCKSSVYKSYQFLERCQRNNKIIQNLLSSQEATEKPSTEHSPNSLRVVIRTSQIRTGSKSSNKRKRLNSRRKSARSNLESSTSASDISWSDRDEESDNHDDVDEGNLPVQLAYETDTQEESPQKRPGNKNGESRVPSLVIRNGECVGTLKAPLIVSNSRASRTPNSESAEANDLYQCEFCEGSFPYQLQIRQHLDLYHADRLHELSCKFCSKVCLSATELSKHCLQKHASTKVIECKICQRTFTSNQGLYQHYRTIMHRAACGEAVYPRRRNSYISVGTPDRASSVASPDHGCEHPQSSSRPRRKSTQLRPSMDLDYDPYVNVNYEDVSTYKCDYCDEQFYDHESLGRHTAVQPCRVEVEQLNLDQLLEKVDLDELLSPINGSEDIAIVEPPIEIVDLT
ncbi:zinc finger protein 652-B-like isoform X2 [Uranotaenia lowii]|nr:zinc finger protein 652-B-like isoform X2 [Uranotaenia lowii]